MERDRHVTSHRIATAAVMVVVGAMGYAGGDAAATPGDSWVAWCLIASAALTVLGFALGAFEGQAS